jgi:hypothetical protein
LVILLTRKTKGEENTEEAREVKDINYTTLMIKPTPKTKQNTNREEARRRFK